MNRFFIKNLGVGFVSVIIISGTAAPAIAAKASPLSEIYACAVITDNTQRLACFDDKVPQLKVKEEKKEFVTIDAQSAKTIKREAFGFSIPSLPKLAFPDLKKDKREKVEFEVASVSKGANGLIFRMKNGQVWHQSSGSYGYIPKGDLVATIKPKSLGSFSLSATNGKRTLKGIKVKRVK